MKDLKLDNELKEMYISCECMTPDHHFRMMYFEDDIDETWPIPELYVSVYLSDVGFFERLWYGIKYIFGFKCKYGAFEEVVISPKKAKWIRDFLNFYLENKETSFPLAPQNKIIKESNQKKLPKL
jgi:hypothetical protein